MTRNRVFYDPLHLQWILNHLECPCVGSNYSKAPLRHESIAHTLCACPSAGVPVEPCREPEKLHQQPSAAGHLHGQRQCGGHRLPDHRLLLQDQRDQVSGVHGGEFKEKKEKEI